MYSLGGADDCSACKVGEWSKEAATGCSPCPQYMVYNETMKKCTCLASFISQEDNTCTCKAGEMLMGTACAPCETAKWKSDIGVISCNLCSSTPQGSTTNSLGSISNSSCICPAGKYDDLNGKCEDVKEGMNHTVAGMTLETLEIEPEYWRTNSRSADIRECPVREACVGGNGTDYCREGHDGPYCNLCFDCYAKDIFLLCQSCDTTATSLVLSILFFFVVAGLLFSVAILLKRNKTIYKRSKNGVKIIFTGLHITSALPAVAPTMPFPEIFKEAVKSVQFFNGDLFELVSAGCISAGFNYYDRLLVDTLPILLFCTALVVAGRRSKSNGSRFFNAALAVLYLTLPTITTTVFGIFSCDTLDDERSMLRADYRQDL